MDSKIKKLLSELRIISDICDEIEKELKKTKVIAKKKTDKEGEEWTVNKQLYRDMHKSPFYEAICPHGVGHHKGIHGCDGCCAHAPKSVWSVVSKD